jgi:hypothetical protein
VPGSNCTPTGRFRVWKKIGRAARMGTIFRSREVVGHWRGETCDEDLILSRILWLDGLDAANGNTRDRYIYIHGTNQEEHIGQPASHGCVRMTNMDVIDLFRRLPEGAEVVIEETVPGVILPPLLL